jgi:hypothetical protein
MITDEEAKLIFTHEKMLQAYREALAVYNSEPHTTNTFLVSYDAEDGEVVCYIKEAVPVTEDGKVKRYEPITHAHNTIDNDN